MTAFWDYGPKSIKGKNSVTGGKNTKTAQDIYYIKQTPRCAIFAATVFPHIVAATTILF